MAQILKEIRIGTVCLKIVFIYGKMRINEKKMKMKKLLLFLTVGMLMTACSSDELEFTLPQEQSVCNLQGVVMTVPGFVPSEGNEQTRTELTPTSTGMNFAWKSGDQVGIYTASTSMANFDIVDISQDAKSATFDGGGFSLTGGCVYYAFYPYDAASTQKTAISVNYTGQNQRTNNDCSHLGNYDYMTAKATATGTNEAAFDFRHVGAIIRLKLSVPQDGTYTRLTISSPIAIPTEGTIDLTANTPILSSTNSTNNVVLHFDDVLSSGKVLTAYMILPPCDLSGQTLTCSIEDSEGACYSGLLSGKNLEAGKAYGFTVTLFNYADGHAYVDLGLPSGTLWATTNVGAIAPEEYGNYFAWGETESKDTYNWSTYKWCNGTYNSITKYCTNSRLGVSDRKTILDPEDDAAHVNWGGYWRMPTKEEQDELRGLLYLEMGNYQWSKWKKS